MTDRDTGTGTGGSYHYGDNVTVNGTGNIGIVKNQSPTVAQQASPLLEAEFEALRRMLLELRAQVEPASARSIDRSLPAITAGCPRRSRPPPRGPSRRGGTVR